MTVDQLDVSALSIEDLKALKRRWYSEARADGAIAACYRVGRTLGTELTGAKYGPKYLWTHGEGADAIVIYVDDYGRYMTVTVGEQVVCSTHPNELLFVPGAWTETVRELEPGATERAHAERAARERRERASLLRQLGLGGAP